MGTQVVDQAYAVASFLPMSIGVWLQRLALASSAMKIDAASIVRWLGVQSIFVWRIMSWHKTELSGFAGFEHRMETSIRMCMWPICKADTAKGGYHRI